MSLITKRAVDLVFAGLVLIAASPLYLVVYLVVLVGMGRPVIFRQMRPGYRAQPFCLYKFRTMSHQTHVDGRLLADHERIGRLGLFIRKLSLDELPQFWNVLKGDMSIVGPRPLLMEYLPLYTAEQMRRHEVKPGITGLAQVSGRNDVPWERRFDLDVWYVENWSLWLDFRIILKTIQKVIARKGVSAAGHVTVEYFKGSNQKRKSE